MPAPASQSFQPLPLPLAFSCARVGGLAWTEWYNEDDEAGSGDFEARDRQLLPPKCTDPVDIECVDAKDGRDWRATQGEVEKAGGMFAVPCTIDGGMVCRTSGMDTADCKDYRVRYLCRTGASASYNYHS